MHAIADDWLNASHSTQSLMIKIQKSGNFFDCPRPAQVRFSSIQSTWITNFSADRWTFKYYYQLGKCTWYNGTSIKTTRLIVVDWFWMCCKFFSVAIECRQFAYLPIEPFIALPQCIPYWIFMRCAHHQHFEFSLSISLLTMQANVDDNKLDFVSSAHVSFICYCCCWLHLIFCLVAGALRCIYSKGYWLDIVVTGCHCTPTKTIQLLNAHNFVTISNHF